MSRMLCRLVLLASIGWSNGDFCARMYQVRNLTRFVADGLSGQTITVASSVAYDQVYLRRDTVTGELQGFEVELLDVLSKLGNFTYQFKLYDKKPADVTWDEQLVKMANEADLVTHSWWTISAEREIMGLVSPWPFQDQSPVIVQLEPEPVPVSLGQIVFQFCHPFKIEVWFAVMIMIIITAAVYFFIERGVNPDEVGGPASEGFGNSLYVTILQWTCGANPTPVSPAGKLVVVAWSFTGLLFVASYTANLASFLIARPVPPPLFKDILDVHSQNKMVCLCPTTNAGKAYLSYYGGYSNKLNTSEYPGQFVALSEKKCDVTVSTIMQTKTRMKDSSVQDRCKLRNIGLPFASSGGGWMVKLDYSVECKVLVRDTLRTLFLQLEKEGGLRKVIDENLLDTTAPPCSAEKEEDTQSSLDMTAMLGIVLVHGVLLGVAILMFFFEKSTPMIQAMSAALSRQPPPSARGIELLDVGTQGGNLGQQELVAKIVQIEKQLSELKEACRTQQCPVVRGDDFASAIDLRRSLSE